MKRCILILFLIITWVGYGQKNQTVLISNGQNYDKSIFADVELKEMKTIYSMEVEGLGLNKYDFINAKEKVIYKEVEDRLISKEELNTLTQKKLKAKDEEFNKKMDSEGFIFQNSNYLIEKLFKAVYIYKPLDQNKGILYKTKWIYAIE